jgi:hypothetical protein
MMTFHYMIVEKPDRVETFSEDHRLALFSRADMISAFQRLGLIVRHLPLWSPGRGLFVAKRLEDLTEGLKTELQRSSS